MIQQREIKKTTEFSECGHVDVLLEFGWLTTGAKIDMPTGKTQTVVVLWKLKEGKDGRLSVKGDWIEVRHCPLCGEKLKIVSEV